MEVNCEGCAGCCMDWRPLLEDGDAGTGRDPERRDGRPHDPFDDGDGRGSSREPLDEDANFVALTRDEVRGFLEAGLAAALTPRFWRVRDERGGGCSPGASSEAVPQADNRVAVDGHDLPAIAGRPVFAVGLRKPPKPVAPFGRADPTWLPTCVFLDPTTLQCRIHGDERFPDDCAAYPRHNLALEERTECERVERAFGGDRLLERDHDDPEGLLLGPQAIGAKLFGHPRPDDLEGIVDRAATGDLTREDRAELLAVAAASSPGTLAVSEHHYERARDRALEGERRDGGPSWVGPAIREWYRRHASGGPVPSPAAADAVETDRGAPETPGWDGLE